VRSFIGGFQDLFTGNHEASLKKGLWEGGIAARRQFYFRLI